MGVGIKWLLYSGRRMPTTVYYDEYYDHALGKSCALRILRDNNILCGLSQHWTVTTGCIYCGDGVPRELITMPTSSHLPGTNTSSNFNEIQCSTKERDPEVGSILAETLVQTGTQCNRASTNTMVSGTMKLTPAGRDVIVMSMSLWCHCDDNIIKT